MLDRVFHLKQHGTTVSREAVAGLTTFAAMAYILVVNPSMLSATGMDQAALITSTAIAAAIGSLLMGLLTNYPIAQAPGMGLNAFFTYTICLQMQVPWQGALGMVFWNGIIFLILSVTGFQKLVVEAIPASLKIAIQSGIGLFIALIGLQNAGIIVDHPDTMVTLGPLSDGLRPNAASLAILGLILVIILNYRKVPGAILVAILAITALGLLIPSGDGKLTATPDGLVSLPASPGPVLFQVDFLYPFRNWQTAWHIVLTLLFVDMFDSVGTLIGVSRRAKLLDKQGQLPKMKAAMTADAAATTIGACIGTSPVTSYIESATGVEAGGKTGLTAVIVALCFLLALVFHPVILVIPAAATAPALIFVGVLMMQGLKDLSWGDLTEVTPAIATVLLIPLSFQIASGIALGCILYVLIMIGTGKPRRVHWLLALLAILFALKFALVVE